MPYRFVLEAADSSDFASGRVLYNLPGAPAFPVRLASEIFQRALHHLPGGSQVTLFDPTCGAAAHLTALGFLHGTHIRRILACDSDPRALETARRNLNLLSLEGLERREGELRAMYEAYGKESHEQALQSAAALRARLEGCLPIPTRAFLANALDPAALAAGLAGQTPNLVFCDVPYGHLSGWDVPPALAGDERTPLALLLEALRSLLPAGAVAAVTADKGQKIAHTGYQRLERFQIGKRQAALLRPAV
jgi:hypothetical protein